LMYYKLGGGTWEYPSQVPQARGVVPTLPNVTPASVELCKRRIAMQEQVDWVRLAARGCHQHGMKCIGWMRVQNHGERLVGKGPVDEFWELNQHLRDKDLDGTPAFGKLCLGYPQVRRHLVAIAEEVIDMGCDGILLDTMRHLPKACYGDPILERFREQFGLDMRTLPCMDPRVIQVQCDVFTEFCREIRAAVLQRNPAATIHLRVCKPYPFMGVDPGALAREGIVDHIIIEHRAMHPTAPDIRGLVAVCRGTRCTAGAAFTRERWSNEKMPLHPYRIGKEVDDYRRAGAASISFYETGLVIDKPQFCRAIRAINDSSQLPPRSLL